MSGSAVEDQFFAPGGKGLVLILISADALEPALRPEGVRAIFLYPNAEAKAAKADEFCVVCDTSRRSYLSAKGKHPSWCEMSGL